MLKMENHKGEALPWPVTSALHIVLSPEDVTRCTECVDEILRRNGRLRSDWWTSQGVRAGWQIGPCVFIEDHRPIPLFTETGSRPYEYRMFGLAREDDYYLISQDRDPAFEKYMREELGLGTSKVIEVGPHGKRSSLLAHRALADRRVVQQLVDVAKRNGGLTFVPYIATGDIWALAAEIARQSRTSCSVAGPPPALSDLANNKLDFSNLVECVLGQSALPITRRVHSLSQAVTLMQKLTQRSEKIVCKLPSSAGGLGNIVFERAEMSGKSLKQIAAVLDERLDLMNWQGGEELLVGEWDKNVLMSPSAQIWVPDTEDGPPILEGFFVQTVAGERGAFIGAERAELPDAVAARMGHDGLMIATVLQSLGYFGRLSLDAVLLGSQAERADIHWIEANARWGGVSIPMAITARLAVTEMCNPHIVIVQRPATAFRVSGDDLDLTSWRELLFQGGSLEDAQDGIVFLLPPGRRINLIVAIAGKANEARRLIGKALLRFDGGH